MIESILLPDLTVKKEKSLVVNEVSGGVCHYQTGDYQPVKNQNLPKNVYSQALDCIVGCSTSVLFFHDGKTLLGERRCYPQMSWWFPVTGRIKPGLSPVNNCRELCYQQLKLKITNLSRLKFVGTYSFLWRMREEYPQENGKHEISVVFSVNLTSTEIPKVYSLDEFCDMKWMKIEELALGSYHPALIRAIQDYQLANDLATLVNNVVSQEETDLSAIGKKLKLYCSKRLNRKQNKENDESAMTTVNLEALPGAQDLDEGSSKATDEDLGNAKNTREEIDGNLSSIQEENLGTKGMGTDALIDDQEVEVPETTAEATDKILTKTAETVLEGADTQMLNDENTKKIQEEKVDENLMEEDVSANAIVVKENLDMKNLETMTADVTAQNDIVAGVVESEEIKKISDENIEKIGLEKDIEEAATGDDLKSSYHWIENADDNDLSSKAEVGEKAETPTMTEVDQEVLNDTGHVNDPIEEEADPTGAETGALNQLAKEASGNENPRLNQEQRKATKMDDLETDNLETAGQIDSPQKKNLETANEQKQVNQLAKEIGHKENPILNDEQKKETKTDDLKTDNLETADQVDSLPKKNPETTKDQIPVSHKLKVGDETEPKGNGKLKLNNEIVDETLEEQQHVPTVDVPETKDQAKDTTQHIISTKELSENLDTMEVPAGGEIL